MVIWPWRQGKNKPVIDVSMWSDEGQRAINEHIAWIEDRRRERSCPLIGSPCIGSNCKYYEYGFRSTMTSPGTAPLQEIPCKGYRDAHPEYTGGFKLV